MTFVIVGLGNPGKEYEKTRHNAGRMAVELFAKQENAGEFNLNKTANAMVLIAPVAGEKVTLVLPETMMNASGKSVIAFVKNVKSAQKLLVLHDDLDLPLGTIKMVTDRGSGGHKGVESIQRALKTKNFSRIRIGVAPTGKKNQAKKLKDDEKVIKHVIGKFKPAEEVVIKKISKKAVEGMQLFVKEGKESATMFVNTK